MSFQCQKCGFSNPSRDNVYGTICSKCGSYVPSGTKPKFVIEMEERLIRNQSVIRNYLKKKILGEKNGN